MRSGGGLTALRYSLSKAREAGGLMAFYKRMKLRNTCKTCALGMGGQKGGMQNETGGFLEVCKKSFQAQAADMQPPIVDEFFVENSHADLLQWNHKQLEDAGRIGFPLLLEKDATHWKRIHWDEALTTVSGALKDSPPSKATFYASGRSGNEAAFLYQCFARVYGTNNITNCSYYCHQASSVGLGLAIGSGTATVDAEDLEHADFAMVIGANPASNHPRMITRLIDIRARGGKVVIVNPLLELGLRKFSVPSRPMSLLFGSDVSDLYVQPHIGGDLAFLKGLGKYVLEQNAVDRDYVDSFTTGFAEFERTLRNTSWSDIEYASGVSIRDIEQVGKLYLGAHHAIFMWAMGITQHAHGVQNVVEIANIAMLRGMLGRPHAGLLPIRGHSNVQGVGSVGVTPDLKQAFVKKLAEIYGVEMPKEKGMDTLESIEAMGRGAISVAIYLGGNLFSASPDPKWAARCMQNVDTAVYISTKLNPGHFHGRGKRTLILPARTRDEESQSTTQESMFSYVRLSDGGALPLSAEMRSEVDIIASLAHQVLPTSPIDWQSWKDHKELRRGIAQVVPGFAALEKMNTDKVEFTVADRIRHEPKFATEDGRAHFTVTEIPKFALKEGELRLMTLRSEGQFNTVVYEEDDIYRGVKGRDVLLMNKEDAIKLELSHNERVCVTSSAGRYGPVRVHFADIRTGNLGVYFPEANVLVPRHVDAKSRTPVFKSVAVRVQKEVSRSGQ